MLRAEEGMEFTDWDGFQNSTPGQQILKVRTSFRRWRRRQQGRRGDNFRPQNLAWTGGQWKRCSQPPACLSCGGDNHRATQINRHGRIVDKQPCWNGFAQGTFPAQKMTGDGRSHSVVIMRGRIRQGNTALACDDLLHAIR